MSVEPLVANGNPARFKVVNHWLGKDGQPVLIESTTISIFANRLIAYDAQLTAAKDPVTFGDTKEGLFGFRMVEFDARESRRQRSSKRRRTARRHANAGAQPSDWVDYDGNVDGKTGRRRDLRQSAQLPPLAVSRPRLRPVFDQPFGESAYTNGKNAAAPFVLKPGANLRLRYAIYIHGGDTKAADVAGTYRKYVASAGD